MNKRNKNLEVSLQNLIDRKNENWDEKKWIFKDCHVLNLAMLQSAKG